LQSVALPASSRRNWECSGGTRPAAGDPSSGLSLPTWRENAYYLRLFAVPPKNRCEEQAVTQNQSLSRANLKTPKAAAIAGMLFSVLTVAAFWLLWISVPADPREPGSWLGANSSTVALGLNLVPFAGIAFLWFIGVLRDRLGRREDRFFATVFLGSGLLFLGMLFTAAAMVGGLLMAFEGEPGQLIDSATYYFARAAVYNIVNIYMTKMTGVFMITTSTMAVYTGFAPRWLAILGYALALLVLFGSYQIAWSFVVFPLWVFITSAYILVDNVGRPGVGARVRADTAAEPSAR
jgi:MFS family permease